MSNTIKLKRGSGSDPSASDLVAGEVALRTDTGKLFTKKDNGNVAEIGGSGISDGDKGDITVSNSGDTFTIDDDAITTSKIFAGAVNDGKLASNAVTNVKVASDAAIAGSKISPSFTDNVTITNAAPALVLVDSDHNSDFNIQASGGVLAFNDSTNSATRLSITSSGVLTTNACPVLDPIAGSINITGGTSGGRIAVQGTTTSANTGIGEQFYFWGTNKVAGFIAKSGTDTTNKDDGSLHFYTSSTGTVTERLVINTDGHIDVVGNIDMPDDAKIKLGTGDDLQIFHDGTHSKLVNGTGDLHLASNNAVKILGGSDLIEEQAVFNDNGSVTLYYDNVNRIDTTAFGINIIGDARWGDNRKATFGNDGTDLQIYHDGSHSRIVDAGTGVLSLQSNDCRIHSVDASKFMAKFVEDGAVELYYNNSKKFETTSGGVHILGTLEGDNLKASNPGNNALLIQNPSNGIIGFGANNQTNQVIITAGGNLSIPSDSTRMLFGASDDLQIYHDGSNSRIHDSGTGVLAISGSEVHIQNAAQSENCAKFIQDGAVELYYNNDLHFATTANGVKTNGDLSFRGDGDVEQILFDASDASLKFTDNKKAKFGTGDDLQIYHNASHSYLEHTGTGNIHLRGNGTDQIKIQAKGGEQSIICLSDAAVELYYDNSKKFETTSYGGIFGNDTSSGVASPVRLSLGGTYHSSAGGDPKLSVWTNGTEHMGFGVSGNQLDVILTQDIYDFVVYGGNSGTTERFRVYGDATGIKLPDSSKAIFGASNDLQIYHDGSNSHIAETGTGVLKISGSAGVYINKHDNSETMAAFLHDAAVELYYDNSKKFETKSYGALVSGGLDVNTGSVKVLTDGYKFEAGASGDLQIYHDGSNSYIDNSTGDFFIRNNSNAIKIRPKSDEESIVAHENGAVELHYDNSKKFETTSVGATVTSGGNSTLKIQPGGSDVYATLTFNNSSGTGVASIGTHAGATTIYYISPTHLFHIGGGYKLQMSGNSMQPYSGVTNFDLGASGARFNNIYTSDLDLSNEAKGGNDVDGTWGSYTIQEGAEDLFLINKRSGKKYKFNLTEVN